MKKYLLLLVLFLMKETFAQSVSISSDGSLPASGAMLDIKSISKGLLIPRVSLTGTDDITTIPARPESLLIYNTAITTGARAVSAGYYYWNETAWVRLITAGNSLTSGWSLGGNAGTSPAMHFIGTTDNSALAFRINNQPAGFLGTNGNVFLGNNSGNINATAYNNIGIGRNALFNNTYISGMVAIGDSALFSNTSGYDNTAIGTKALRSNSGGIRNTAMGPNTLLLNTTGIGNTAIGSYSLSENTTGSFNSAYGVSALYSNTGVSNSGYGSYSLSLNTTGSYNSAYGVESIYKNTTGSYNASYGIYSLFQNITGNYNTAIGAYSDVALPNLSYATAIGANAKVGCSNCLVLGNNANVGIGISTPAFPLNFATALGDKISLWGTTAAHYGMGIQNNLFQLYADGVTSDIAFGYGSSSAFTENMRISGAGNLNVRGSITANSSFYTSDSRYKKEITAIENGLEKIIQLNGYHYYWNDDEQDKSLQSGVIAQEVQALFPELVKEDAKGMLSVNYVGLIPYLIQSIKEQQQQRNADQEKIQQLARDVAELKKLVKELTAK